MAFARPFSFFSVTAATLAALTLASPYASACTRIFSNTNATKIVGRTMDWATTTEPTLMVMPRGLSHDGGRLGPTEVIPVNPLRWTSKYGSVVTTIFGIGTADGMNERGLSAHMLYFPPAAYGERDIQKPGLQAALWAQYALDSSATVSEAIANLQKVQLVKISLVKHGQTQTATVHVALEDASGDSAVLEMIGGKLIVYHGRQYRVMTNAPAYDEQLKLLATRNFANPTMETLVPGNVNPRDRFQRASYYLSVLSVPKNERQSVAGILTVTRSVSIPYGAPVNGSTFDTEYRTVSDLTHRKYYFELTSGPNVMWIDFKNLAFAAGSSVMKLDPHDIALSNEVSGKFSVAEAPF